MAQLNSSFAQLEGTYIFTLIEERLQALEQSVPRDKILNFGIGDVALPLSSFVAEGIVRAVQEMTTVEGIHGYGPSDGYPFLKSAIREAEFSSLGIKEEEIFISDGANSDVVNILDLFSEDTSIAIMSPSYPVYVKACTLKGMRNVDLLPCLEEHGFSPQIPEKKYDLIYLCSPNNPTGVALTHRELANWVDYAKKHESILLVDAAYASFIRSKEVPASIYSIEGAKECAIECRSFSKSAGFTALRCAYAVIPQNLMIRQGEKRVSLASFWKSRQNIKSNGVSYPIQRGAEASLQKLGQREVREQVDSYLQLAAKLKGALQTCGFTCYGGVDSPYLWVKTPLGVSSWEFFESLLKKCYLLSIPGCGFGKEGEGFVRFSCFSTREKIDLALNSLQSLRGNHVICSC